VAPKLSLRSEDDGLGEDQPSVGVGAAAGGVVRQGLDLADHRRTPTRCAWSTPGGTCRSPVLLIAQRTDMSASSPSTDLTPGVVVFLAAVTGLLAAVAYWATVRALPRLMRRPGLRTRRHRYRIWGQGTGVLTVPAAI
jgi:hypothetical protein